MNQFFMKLKIKCYLIYFRQNSLLLLLFILSIGSVNLNMSMCTMYVLNEFIYSFIRVLCPSNSRQPQTRRKRIRPFQLRQPTAQVHRLKVVSAWKISIYRQVAMGEEIFDISSWISICHHRRRRGRRRHLHLDRQNQHVLVLGCMAQFLWKRERNSFVSTELYMH